MRAKALAGQMVESGGYALSVGYSLPHTVQELAKALGGMRQQACAGAGSACRSIRVNMWSGSRPTSSANMQKTSAVDEVRDRRRIVTALSQRLGDGHERRRHALGERLPGRSWPQRPRREKHLRRQPRSDHDTLDLVDRHRVRRPVVELRRLRRRVPGDLLSVLEGPPV